VHNNKKSVEKQGFFGNFIDKNKAIGLSENCQFIAYFLTRRKALIFQNSLQFNTFFCGNGYFFTMCLLKYYHSFLRILA